MLVWMPAGDPWFRSDPTALVERSLATGLALWRTPVHATTHLHGTQHDRMARGPHAADPGGRGSLGSSPGGRALRYRPVPDLRLVPGARAVRARARVRRRSGG